MHGANRRIVSCLNYLLKLNSQGVRRPLPVVIRGSKLGMTLCSISLVVKRDLAKVESRVQLSYIAPSAGAHC